MYDIIDDVQNATGINKIAYKNDLKNGMLRP